MMQMQVQREESASAAAGAQEDPKYSLSFRLDSPERISAVDRHINDVDQIHGGGEDGDGEDDFDFSFIRIPDSGPSIAAADDIFSDGKILPVYPVFNRDLLKEEEEEEEEKKEEEEDQTLKSIRAPLRRLFIEEERDRASSFSSTSSSSASSSLVDELDGVQAGTYCVWSPNKDHRDRCKKSRSTGPSMSFRWRLRDLVVGRSQSDGKEKFVFIPITRKGNKDGGGGGSSNSKKESSTLELEKSSSSKGKKKTLGKSPPPSSTEVDLVTAQKRMLQHYGQGAGSKGSASGRRSYLPYKPDLVGFFSNVNGLTRSHHHPV